MTVIRILTTTNGDYLWCDVAILSSLFDLFSQDRVCSLGKSHEGTNGTFYFLALSLTLCFEKL